MRLPGVRSASQIDVSVCSLASLRVSVAGAYLLELQLPPPQGQELAGVPAYDIRLISYRMMPCELKVGLNVEAATGGGEGEGHANGGDGLLARPHALADVELWSMD